MDRLSRRSFLGRALLAGAGASFFHPHEVLASSSFAGPLGSLDPDYDPGFIAGTIIASSGGVLTILDDDDLVRQARLTSTSQTWKAGIWDVSPPSVGDCTYVRGAPSLDGSIDVERLWANIQSITTEVIAVATDSFTIRLSNGLEKTVLVTPLTEVETPTGDWITGSVTTLTSGQTIQLIGFTDSQEGQLTATKVFVFLDAPIPDGEEPAVSSVTFLKLGTWYCCHGAHACGSSGMCLSGDGACGVCRSSRRQTAYPRLSTTNCEQCGSAACCLELPRRACGASATILNPCNNRSVNVRIQDCIGSTDANHPAVGCRNRHCRVLDLTPCAFSEIGNLDAGVLNMNITL